MVAVHYLQGNHISQSEDDNNNNSNNGSSKLHQ